MSRNKRKRWNLGQKRPKMLNELIQHKTVFIVKISKELVGILR